MRSSAISTLDPQAASRETPTCRNPAAGVEKLETPQVPMLDPPAREPKRPFSSRWMMIPDNRDAQPKADGSVLSRPAHARTGFQCCRFEIATHIHVSHDRS